MSSIGSSTTVYVISGTNRGIGLGLVEQLALRADACIYAGVRDISKADKLQQLAKQHSNVRIMQLSAESDEDHTVLQKQVEAEAGRVDVVIANAGIAIYEKTGKITLANARTMYEVNFLGPVRLFQSLLPLLALSSNPRFVSISSAVGSITLQPTIGAFAVGAYGGTKVALNLLVQRIHVEHTSLTAFVVNPGNNAHQSTHEHSEECTAMIGAADCSLCSSLPSPLCVSVCCRLRLGAIRRGQLRRSLERYGAGANQCGGQLQARVAVRVRWEAGHA